MTKISTIAMKLAIEAKSCGLTHDTASVCVDAGFYEAETGRCDGLVSEALSALLDEIDEALPRARFDRRIAAAWARAGASNAAETASQSRAASYGD